MQAIVHDRYGATDVLEPRDIEPPVASDAKVLVRVPGACNGAFAEWACTDEGKLCSIPTDVTFAQAAAVPVAGASQTDARNRWV